MTPQSVAAIIDEHNKEAKPPMWRIRTVDRIMDQSYAEFHHGWGVVMTSDIKGEIVAFIAPEHIVSLGLVWMTED